MNLWVLDLPLCLWQSKVPMDNFNHSQILKKENRYLLSQSKDNVECEVCKTILMGRNLVPYDLRWEALLNCIKELRPSPRGIFWEGGNPKRIALKINNSIVDDVFVSTSKRCSRRIMSLIGTTKILLIFQLNIVDAGITSSIIVTDEEPYALQCGKLTFNIKDT